MPTCAELMKSALGQTWTSAAHRDRGNVEEERMSAKLERFRAYREKMNECILAEKNQQINRFFALDTRAYEKGALDVRTQELLAELASEE